MAPADAARKPKPPKPTTTTTTTTTVPPPPPVAAEAVAYHVNPLHTGSQSADPLSPNLQQRWTKDLGGPVSYPVVAGGKVFVTVGNAGAYGTKLYALDLATGSIAWGPVDLGGTYWWSASAYEGGRLFVLNYDGVLRAFDAATGAQHWTVDLPGQWSFDSPPTAWKGVVYTGGAGSGGTLYAVSAENGSVLWTRPVANGGTSSPAVTDTDVYVSYSCPNVYDFDRVSGVQQWTYGDGCSGGGGKTPALSASGLYVRDWSGDVVLDPDTGALRGAFSSGPIPSFDATTGYFLNGTTLEAHDQSTGTLMWSFTGDGRLTSAPVTANGYVYVGSAGGNVYALRASTGEVVTTVNVGSAVPAPDEHNVSQPLTGMAIGLGHLVVPATNSLIVYGN
jgi:outer membrane protein assembly factor BamB